VELKLAVAEGLAAEFDKVIVMGEEEDLGAFGQGPQLREDGLGAVVVEGHEQVVEDQWQRLVRIEVLFQRGQAEGEEQLITRAIAHAVDSNPGIVRADADEDGNILGVELGAEAAEGTAGDAVEHGAGLGEQRALVLLSEALNLILEKVHGEAQAHKARGIAPEGGRARLGLLAKIGGSVTGLFEFLLLIAELEQG